LKKTFQELKDRHISRATAEKYGIWRDKEVTYFPYFNDNKHLANKVRSPDKDFHTEGDIQHSGLFGQNLFPPGSAKFITLVEGEFDAAAAFELLGSRWPVVSVKTGVKGAVKDVTESFEYLNSFPTIVICFDKDEAKVRPNGEIHYPGQESAIAVAGMFPIGKVKILTLAEGKDPNDYLKAGNREGFNREWWAAPGFTPTNLKLGCDMFDEISTPKNYETISYPWEKLNSQTYGIRLSEMVVITADTGVGKTTIISEIEHHIHKVNPEAGIGMLHLEEMNSDTALHLMSKEANLPLHLPDVREMVSSEDFKTYYDKAVNTNKLIFYDHFGSNSIHEILNKVRHMHALGCKYIIIDHLSIIVSDQSGDERKQLDEISTKLKTLCMELNIAVICVIHQNRAGQIRGTAGVEQLGNIVLKLSRERLSDDPWRRNVTKIVIEKNRFSGRSGPSSYLYYNEFTDRLIELTEEQVRCYNEGGSMPL
jgi:twinkle protein